MMDCSITTADLLPRQKSQKSRPKRSQAVQQAVDIQGTLYKATVEGDAKGSVLAQLARAWCEVIDTKLALQMKPKPKPVDVQAMADQKRKLNKPVKGFTETAKDSSIPA